MPRFQDVRARVQPALEQDVDALFEEFAEETGSRDVARFLDHLHEFGLITDALRREALAAALPEALSEPDSEEIESTVVLRDTILDEIAEPQGAVAPEALAPLPGFGDPLDEPMPTRRTMFRRRSDGALQETGVQELQERQERRRRRRAAGDTTDVRRRRRPGNQRYTFVGTVGEGAMGRIHLAEDATLHRKVAYKAMSEEIADEPTLASKFTAEAQITAQLDHPNIVPVYDLDGERAYTMKLIQGRTLEDVVAEARRAHRELAGRKGGQLDPKLSQQARLEQFLRACDAMAYAHNRGVVHRDLKPENIMVGAFGEVYVMDWGIARVMRGDFPDKVRIGAEPEDEGDLVIGTPGYMSPEQAEAHNEDLDGRSDIYALGLILFELIALKRAVTGKAPLKLVMRHQDGEKDPMVHAFGDKIAPELVAIVDKATARDRDRRYQTVEELAEDVRRFIRGEAVSARKDPPLQALLRYMGRNRELTLALTFTVILASSTLVASVFVYSQFAMAAQRGREQQLSTLLTTVARQSSLIDGQFLKYEGLLSVIATMAVESLGDPTYDASKVYRSTDYDDPALRPPGLVESSRYGMPVSLEHAAFVLPDPRSAHRLQGDMQRLRDLDEHFYRVLLRSHSEEAATYTPKRAQRALAEVGVPVAWAYVGLENGVFTTFPGHGGFPADFDHRESPWYALAKNSRGPTWGAPSLDVSGLGLVLSCAQPLRTSDDEFLGVAGIDVTFDYIIEALLEAPEFADSDQVEAYLLDPEGRVAVRSSNKGEALEPEGTRDRAIRMAAFHHPEVVSAIKEKRSGYLQAIGPDGVELVVYNRMNSIGWYYVVVGDVNELLARGS